MFNSNKIDILLAELSGLTGLNRVKILARLATSLRELNPQKAIEYGEEGLELLRLTKDIELESSILNELNWIYQCLGNHQKALNYGFRLLELVNITNSTQHKATILNRMGTTYFRMEMFDYAIKYFNQSLELREHLRPRVIAGISNNIGMVFEEQGKFKEALNSYNTSMSILMKEKNSESDLAILHNNSGEISKTIGKLQLAEEHFREALRLREKLGEEVRIPKSLIALGTILSDRGKHEESLNYLFKAFNMGKLVSNDEERVEILRRIGISYAFSSNFDSALDYGKKGLTLAETLKNTELKRDCFETLSTINEKSGNFEEAVKYFKQFKEENDNVFEAISQNKYNELRIIHEAEKKEQENEIHRLKNDKLAKANEELKRNMAEISQLSRLLPICCSCKKIRHDSGYWQQIDQYVSAHSDALFEHGLCPECLAKTHKENEHDNG